MLELLFGPKRRASATPSNWWPSRGGTRNTNAGAAVDEDLALTYSAVWSATRLIAETAASLPLFLCRRKKNDDREHATDHPLYPVLKAVPNPSMTSMAFREGRVMHQVNWGNGFAEIEKNRSGDVTALWPIHPSRVRPAWGEEANRGYAYTVRNNDGSRIGLRPEEMLHVPGVLSEDGIWGKGVVTYARESIGMGLATERHGAVWFGSGGQPHGIVYGNGLKDKDARANFRKEWKEIHGSPDASDIAILPIEAKYEPISFSNEDNQFLQSRKHNVVEIARWYRVPAHMLAELMGPAGYNSLEMLSMEFVIYSLLPWLRRWEEQIALKLLRPEERAELYARHELAGLLRGDATTRHNVYRTAIMTGYMCVNEVRRLEDLNGIGPDGDVFYFPMNMQPLGDEEEETDTGTDEGEEPGSDQSGAPDDGMRTVRALPARPASVASVRPVNPAATEAPADPSGDALREAARVVLKDALRWLFTKESNAAKRAAKGKDFDAWLGEFYGKHEEMVRETLQPGFAVLALVTVVPERSRLAAVLRTESVAELRTAYDSDTPDRFAARLARWPTERAETTADKIVAGGYS